MTTMLNLPQDGVAPSLYQEAVTSMRRLFEEVRVGRAIAGAEVLAVTDRLLEALHADGRTLLGLTAQIAITDPMAAHAVNTCILALATAQGLGHDAAHLRDVGAAALLHDVGLVQLVPHGDSKDVSYAAMKQHPRHALELLEHIPELARATLYLTPATSPAHERAALPATASQEPLHSPRDNELRKVIRLADLYEALSHPRADGQPLAFAAVRTLLSAQQLFDARVMKVFFDQVGIYPLGTWAQISTGEIGLVIGIQPGLPLRPTVKILYDRDGLRRVEPREVALSEHPMLFIKRSLTDEPQPRKTAHG